MNEVADTIVIYLWTQCWQIGVIGLMVIPLVMVAARTRPHVALVLAYLIIAKACLPPIWGHSKSLFHWLDRDVVARQIASEPKLVTETAPPTASQPQSHSTRPTEVNEPVPAPNPTLASSMSQPSLVPLAAPSNSDQRSQTVPSDAANRWAWSVVIVWLGGAGVGFGILCRRHRRINSLLKRSFPSEDDEIIEAFEALKTQLGTPRHAQLKLVEAPTSPAVIGWRNPVIIIPQSLVAQANLPELRAVLAHELVHLRRADPLVSLIQCGVQIVWWFHPIIWFTNRQINQLRERCCDGEVIHRCHVPATTYAQALLNVIKSHPQTDFPRHIPSVRNSEVTRFRIETIMNQPHRMSYRTPAAAWGMTIATAIFLLPNKGTSSPEPSPQQAPSNHEGIRSTQKIVESNASETPSNTTETPQRPKPLRANPHKTQPEDPALASSPAQASTDVNFVQLDSGSIFQVTRRDLVVAANKRPGWVFSAKKIEIRTAVDGVVTLNRLSPGTRVKRGDLLFQLANDQLQTAFREAQLNLETAHAAGEQANLERQQLELEHRKKTQTAEELLSLNQAQLDAMKQRFESGQATSSEMLKGQAQVSQAKRELLFLQDSRQLLRQRSENNINLRTLDRDRAELALQSIENQVARLRILSPIDGIVPGSTSTKLPVPGASIPANTLLAELFDPDKLAIRVDFPATMLRNISEGMPCIVSVSPDQELQGTIKTIYPTVNKSLNMTVRVIVVIDDHEAKAARLIPGTQVSVTFYSEIIENALTVLEFFAREKPPEFKAYKLVENRTVALPVMITSGKTGSGLIEISGDIKDGDELFFHNTPSVRVDRTPQFIKLIDQ